MRGIGIDSGDFNIAGRGQMRQQVIALENKAETRAAQLSQFIRTERRGFPPANPIMAELGGSRQPRIFISVDLPEPEAPMIATNSPAQILSVMLFSATASLSPDAKRRVTLTSSSRAFCTEFMAGSIGSAPVIGTGAH